MRLQLENEYYGDETRWFIANVIDSTPPYGLEGRIKIRIHGIHSANINNIPQRDLPWAQVMMPGNMFGVSGLGGNCQIQPGALVFGLFLDGRASQLPIVLGSLPKTEYPTTIQVESRDDIASNPFSYDILQHSYYGTNDYKDGTINTSSVNEKRLIATRFFIDNGYNPVQAAGIIGVLENISNLDSSFDNDNVAGIAGWVKDSDRWINYTRYIGQFYNQTDYNNFALQLTFVLIELRSNKNIVTAKLQNASYIKSKFNGVSIDNRLKNYGSAEIVRRYYADNFTRSNFTSKQASEENAEKAHNAVYA